MEYISVASGSSGNCHYIAYKNTKILIDAGLSGKRIEKNLQENDKNLKDIAAIFITHEHKDHIRGAGILSRRHGIPIYATKNTWRVMKNDVGKIDDKFVRTFGIGDKICIGDLEVSSFHISHDAVDPCGFSVSDGNKRLSVATDLGKVESEAFEYLCMSDLAIIEANYDEELLQYSFYPYSLKSRIKSDTGHLSNKDAAHLALSLVKKGIERISLAHLSVENNRPSLAFQYVCEFLKQNGVTSDDVMLEVLKRDISSGLCIV